MANFHSNLLLNALPDNQASLLEVKDQLKSDIVDSGVSIDPVLDTIAAMNDSDAIVELTKFARSQGLFISLTTRKANGQTLVSVSAPKQNAGQLQAGHH